MLSRSIGSILKGPVRITARLMLLTGMLASSVVLARGPVSPAELRADHISPEAASGFEQRELAHARDYMVSAANPLAARAGADILKAGGSATDAAIAVQLVLNLVEPQSSGIGGGGFGVSYDAKSGQVLAFDGRENAPTLAEPDRFATVDGPKSFWEAVNSGKSVGTPGLVRMLALMHEQQGRLPWVQLFEPAIQLAEQGFPVSARLNTLLAENEHLRQQPAAAEYFYDSTGQAWPVGHILKNPALARVFRELAEQGPDAFYEGRIAGQIVDAVRQHDVPGDLSLSDLQNYQALMRPPLCTPYRIYTLCGMPPPSSGPLAVMQILGILSHTPISTLAPDSLMAVHYFSEAGRLAYADRDKYVADPDFTDVPTEGLLDPRYLQERAGLIRVDQSMGVAVAGEPLDGQEHYGTGQTLELPSTTHIVTADAWGDVVSMTTSIESAFGSKIFVEGFLLNNELTDFSFSATDASGSPVANRIEPLKRPRSSMAPMIVLQGDAPVMAIGSPGGSAIINYVAKAILGVLDWNLNIQQAIDLAHYGSRNQDTELEKGRSVTGLASALRDLGHTVRETDFTSGLQGLVFTADGIQGGADPRREGRAVGH